MKLNILLTKQVLMLTAGKNEKKSLKSLRPSMWTVFKASWIDPNPALPSHIQFSF